jgi:hypothetical protein
VIVSLSSLGDLATSRTMSESGRPSCRAGRCGTYVENHRWHRPDAHFGQKILTYVTLLSRLVLSKLARLVFCITLVQGLSGLS